MNAHNSKNFISSTKEQSSPTPQMRTRTSTDKTPEKNRRLKKDQEHKQLFKTANQSYSTVTTPKNNILTKLLKDKPFTFKNGSYSTKYKVVQDNLK